MLTCPALKKLPKAPGFKSVNFRSQTPGSVSYLLQNRWPPPRLLDRSHPAVSLPKKGFQQFNCNAFMVVAYPMALLSPPERVWEFAKPLETWRDRISRVQSSKTKESEASSSINPPPRGRVSMSFVSTAHKKLSKKRVVRLKLGSRLKTAISLIVVRGADARKDADGERTLVINEQEAKERGNEWILQGWTYIFRPTLEVYRMPYHDLVPLMRDALSSIWKNGMRLEKEWEALALRSNLKALREPSTASVNHATNHPAVSKKRVRRAVISNPSGVASVD